MFDPATAQSVILDPAQVAELQMLNAAQLGLLVAGQVLTLGVLAALWLRGLLKGGF